MAWFRVDDKFPRHPKVMRAAEHLGGKNGKTGRILAVWMEAGCYCSEHSTDGYISELVARSFLSDRKPIEVLSVLAFDDVKLMYRVDGGFQFHDWLHYNPSAESVKAKREADRERKRGVISTRNPVGIRAESEWNPERSRARVPTRPPLPFGKKEQRADAPVSFAEVQRHLKAACYRLIQSGGHYADGSPHQISSLDFELKRIAAHDLKVADYDGRKIASIIDAVLGERARRPA